MKLAKLAFNTNTQQDEGDFGASIKTIGSNGQYLATKECQIYFEGKNQRSKKASTKSNSIGARMFQKNQISAGYSINEHIKN